MAILGVSGGRVVRRPRGKHDDENDDRRRCGDVEGGAGRRIEKRARIPVTKWEGGMNVVQSLGSLSQIGSWTSGLISTKERDRQEVDFRVQGKD
jgi:hypothetical protein